MKLNTKELEEVLTIAEQCKVLLPKLSYNDELVSKLFYCMKDKKELEIDDIQRSHNNYLALCLIGLNHCDSSVFKKLDDYMENEYH